MNRTCPNCGYCPKSLGQYIIKEGTIIFEKDLFQKKWHPIECYKCGWRGYGFDLIDKIEYRSYKRTKLIDKILNE